MASVQAKELFVSKTFQAGRRPGTGKRDETRRDGRGGGGRGGKKETTQKRRKSCLENGRTKWQKCRGIRVLLLWRISGEPANM